ncbi:hypothetical protein ACVI1J_003602 [Bradyrhizobium diazoefficiens]
MNEKPVELARWLSSRSAVGPILDWGSDDGAPRFMPISNHADEVVAVTRGYDANPKIAVTVDLLTTGVDVPSITNLVFLRRVNSRILYEQMIGRATRLCPEIGKEVFRIFDPVDVYSHLQNLTELKPVVVKQKIAILDPKSVFDLTAIECIGFARGHVSNANYWDTLFINKDFGGNSAAAPFVSRATPHCSKARYIVSEVETRP